MTDAQQAFGFDTREDVGQLFLHLREDLCERLGREIQSAYREWTNIDCKNLILLLNLPAGSEQSCVSFPGRPSFFSIVTSAAAVRLVFIVSFGGTGTRSSSAMVTLPSIAAHLK